MIFYFSGTGNSKWVAEQIAAATNEKIISIGEAIVKGEYRYTLNPGERIGWVFPIHSWGPAPVVLDFISKWHIYNYTPATYCYMVAVCGDDIGKSVDMWRKALGGIAGNAAFSIQMPNNYILLPGFDVDPKDEETRKLNAAKQRIENISLSIAERRSCVDVVEGKLAWCKSHIIYPIYKKSAMSDARFTCNPDLCNSCGLCERECPVNNIKMDANRHPQWGGKCEMCLSCIHRCPTRAIEYGKISLKKGRYHHK